MKATKTVYCYYFPEIRKIIDALTKKFPHEIFLKSINPGLDDFHFPIIDKYIKYHSENLPKLKDFKYKYFTGGASEGIFHLLIKIKTENPNAIVYVLKGEYEGYKEYAKRINLRVIELDENQDFSKLKKGFWFISNPSARNGNIVSNNFINKICKYHKVIFDSTYVGLTKKHEFDVSNPNIIAVISSMSKPFGLYYYRIGFTFSRKPIQTLTANIWFKNIFSLLIANKIFDTIKSDYFYKKYRLIQEKIVKNLNQNEKLDLKKSDVLLLAYSTKKSKLIEKYKRNKFYRLCLTPYLLEEEKNET
jgi:histidinol-phosphate/aromatic aminotransferase/cobyric acid decarboxylase-like protein